jgi:calcium-dependent protein kinase
LNCVGQGGFGKVYKALYKETDQFRAIKVMKKSQANTVKSFQIEVSIFKKLDHPNIIKLYEMWEDKSYYFLVMDFCEGGDLLDRIDEKQGLDAGQAAHYLKQVLGALAYLHSNNICHRDIKPENFLLVKKEDVTQIKMIDFGLAK